MLHARRAGGFAFVAILVVSCGGSNDSGSGVLNLAVTDAPVDAAARVVVEFSGVELKPREGPAFTIDIAPDRQIDVLALSDGASELILDNAQVPAGAYEWIRLQVNATLNAQDDSFVELQSGERFPLFIPSGSERGLQLIRGFTIAQGSVSNFTIDFDLRKSVIDPPGLTPNYLLKPVLRVVDDLEAGTLAGTVAATRATTDGCTPFVYVFTGAGAEPDDLDAGEGDVDPLVSVPAELDTASGEWRYRVAFLEAGTYTISFTCDGTADTPEGDETLEFESTRDATIAAGQTTTVDFT